MRLGGILHRPENVDELNAVIPTLDTYGLSAIPAPARLADMPDDEVAAFAQRARQHDVVIAEAHYLVNLITSDVELRARRIKDLQHLLRKGDLLGCLGVIGFVGTGKPHPYLFTDNCKREFREVVLRVMDGLDLVTCHFMVEASPKSFFYAPEDIAQFIESVGHPRFSLHLDQMNMVSQSSYYNTTELIETTFKLLTPYIRGAHLKDVRWDWGHMLLKYDEVLIGEGVLDYPTLLKSLSALPEDTPTMCEHLQTEAQYAQNYARLRKIARDNGLSFAERKGI